MLRLIPFMGVTRSHLAICSPLNIRPAASKEICCTITTFISSYDFNV